jgi:hypothetical protein
MMSDKAPPISWPSRTLPWLLPSVLTLAPQSSTCIFVSPWVQDISLKVGKSFGLTSNLDDQVSLSALIRWLHNEHSKRFFLYLRADEIEKNLPRLRAFREATKGILETRGVPNLHAKMVITDQVIIETSANLLERSYYVNVENVTLRPNPYQKAEVFINHFREQQGGISRFP